MNYVPLDATELFIAAVVVLILGFAAGVATCVTATVGQALPKIRLDPRDPPPMPHCRHVVPMLERVRDSIDLDKAWNTTEIIAQIRAARFHLDIAEIEAWKAKTAWDDVLKRRAKENA